MTSVARPWDLALLRLLEGHRDVAFASDARGTSGLEFEQDGWKRRVMVGDASCEVAGLIELCDNNPIVCADAVSVPGPVATLALIGLGPLVRAGLLDEPPVMQVAGAEPGEDVDGFLAREGWSEGVVVSYGDEDLGGVVAANVVAVVPTPSDWSSLDELYRECFGRSFYVRENVFGDWDSRVVSGQPFAVYDLSHTMGDATSLLTVRVMADRDGKCGAAQIVHAMNLMCGFEECEGVDGRMKD